MTQLDLIRCRLVHVDLVGTTQAGTFARRVLLNWCLAWIVKHDSDLFSQPHRRIPAFRSSGEDRFGTAHDIHNMYIQAAQQR